MTVARANRTCPECSVDFTPHHGRQRFCTDAHREHFYAICARRGKVAMPLMMAWRSAKRGASPDSTFAFRELCSALDQWSAADAKAGRKSGLVVAERREMGRRAVDLG